MGRVYLVKLDGRIYSCRFCHSHLATYDDLVSKAFYCRQGKAYLFNTVFNVSEGPKEERMMTTGMHIVCDIYCNCCHQIVGWKYERAYERSQKYKEGMFILELARTAGGSGVSDFYSGANHASTSSDIVHDSS